MNECRCKIKIKHIYLVKITYNIGQNIEILRIKQDKTKINIIYINFLNKDAGEKQLACSLSFNLNSLRNHIIACGYKLEGVLYCFKGLQMILSMSM